MSELLGRLEPRTRSGDLEPGLAARVLDPAWLLARQWMFGELDGDDAGTPVEARLDVDVHPLSRLVLAGGTVDHDPARVPLDPLVERARVRTMPGWTPRERVDAGRELLHQLREHGLNAATAPVAAAYPISRASTDSRLRDPDGARLLDVAAGRLPDGELVYGDVAAGGILAGLPPAVAGSAEVQDAMAGWRAWIAATLSEPAAGEPDPAWVPERFEHALEVVAPSRQGRLVASSHRGDLDWYSFDEQAGPAATETPERRTVLRAPTPVRFRGMPNPRYWELEDASVDLGAVDAAPTDLARLALLEFAFTYGNDAFAVPLRVPVGCLAEVAALVVSDTFGETVQVPPALRAPGPAGPGWSFLALSDGGTGRSPALLVPHAAVHALRGAAAEEVSLLRDEMANIVWAVEHRVEGGTGRALPRAEEEARRAAPAATPSSAAPLRYLLQTAAPPSWFPLVLQPGLPRMLQLQTLAPSNEPPRGRILPPPGGQLHEEEVTREGVRVVRDYALVRWIDGSTHVWARNRRTIGRGEGTSGLRFDTAEPAEPEPA